MTFSCHGLTIIGGFYISIRFSLGLITTSASLELLLPPSLLLILYGVVSKTSIDKLFLAGILPGALIVVFLSVFNASLPFLFIHLLALIVITYWPKLSLFLVQLAF